MSLYKVDYKLSTDAPITTLPLLLSAPEARPIRVSVASKPALSTYRICEMRLVEPIFRGYLSQC